MCRDPWAGLWAPSSLWLLECWLLAGLRTEADLPGWHWHCPSLPRGSVAALRSVRRCKRRTPGPPAEKGLHEADAVAWCWGGEAQQESEQSVERGERDFGWWGCRIHLQNIFSLGPGCVFWGRQPLDPSGCLSCSPPGAALCIAVPQPPAPSPIWVYIPVHSHSSPGGGHGRAPSGPLMTTSVSACHRAGWFSSDFYLHLRNLDGICAQWAPSPRSCQFRGEGGGWGGLPRHQAQRRCPDGLQSEAVAPTSQQSWIPGRDRAGEHSHQGLPPPSQAPCLPWSDLAYAIGPSSSRS